jgi:tRNA modification GTPase
LAERTREATRSAAQRADLICLVVDLSRLPQGPIHEPLDAVGRSAAVIAANKIDLLEETAVAEQTTQLTAAGLGPVCPVSAKTGAGLPVLRTVIQDQLAASMGGGEDRTIALTARQQQSLHHCRAALRRAEALAAGITVTLDAADLLALELREALDALSAITGAVTTDDLLARVFSTFCIGK